MPAKRTADAPRREDLVEAARKWVPTLRERSEETERLRMIPEQTVAEFKERGFHRICQPERFGGLGFWVDAACDVAIEVGKGDPSVSWMTGQWPGHNFMVGYFTEQAQEEYFGGPNGFDTMSSTASAIKSLDVKEVDGGYRASAHVRFSSGCDFSEWIFLSLPPYGSALVPRSDYRVEDDWFVMGMRGTGSKAVVMDDIFVPEHRVVRSDRLMTGTTYGADLYPENPYYRTPYHIVLNTLLLSSIIGTGYGLLEIFEERAQNRVDLHTGQKACERPGTQMRFAESAAEIDAAYLVSQRVHRDLQEWGLSGELMPMEVRARLRRDVGFATKLCVAAADRLLEAGDASGMFDAQLLQRWGRDIHMGGLQFVLTWDEPALAYSRVRWGMPPEAYTT